MRRKRLNLIAALLLLAALVGGLGWLVYAPVRQERLNRALIAAIKQNETKKAIALLAEGADANARDTLPMNQSLWRLLLDRLRGKRPAPSTAPTALWVACCWSLEDNSPRDNATMVKALLDRGAALEAKDLERRRTPLLCALLWGNPAVSKLLIERGADVNACDLAGYTPLILAVFHNNKALVKLLLDRGADVNAIGEGVAWDGPALAAAQWTHGDNPTITKLLLSRGAKVNIPALPKGNLEWTPLYAAIHFDRSKSVRLLLQHGADVNFKPHGEGVTFLSPLSQALEKGDKQIIQMLKQAGAKE